MQRAIGGATLLAKSLRRPIILLIVALAIGVACRHAAVSTSSPRSTLPPGFTARDVAVGDSLFNARSCRRCHGLGGKGTVNGPTFLSARGNMETDLSPPSRGRSCRACRSTPSRIRRSSSTCIRTRATFPRLKYSRLPRTYGH